MSQGFLLFRRCLMARVWAVRDLTTTFADVTASLGQPCGFSVSQFPPLKRWSWKRSGCWSPGLNSGIWDFAVVLLCPCISQGFPEKFQWKVMFVYTCVYTSVQFSRSVVSDSLRPHGLYSPWNSPGQNTGKGSRSLLQVIFPTQGSNPGLPHCRWILF